MKNKWFNYVVVLTMSCALFSCSSDDGNSSNNGGNVSPDSIVGKWSYHHVSEYVGGELEYEEVCEHLCDTDDDYMNFTSTGTFDEMVYKEDCTEEDSDSGTYTLNGANLTLTSQTEGTIAYKILSVSATKLVIEEQGEIDGESYKFRIEYRK